MKCPLIKKVVFQELPTINLVEGDCLEGECTWWTIWLDKNKVTHAFCVQVAIPFILKEVIGDILHELQPRKQRR